MRDAAASQLAIEEHRQLLKLEPTRVESLHALFRLWEGTRQNDKAFCAAAVLQLPALGQRGGGLLLLGDAQPPAHGDAGAAERWRTWTRG